MKAASIILFLLVALTSSYAQQKEVKGKILDYRNNPIPGANIMLKGTSYGVVADSLGHFTITIPYGTHKLYYAFVGYKSYEQEIFVNKDFAWTLEVTLPVKGQRSTGTVRFTESRSE